MSTKFGNASRARELAILFEVWRQAFEAQDVRKMAAARRVIDTMVAGEMPRPADMAVISAKR